MIPRMSLSTSAAEFLEERGPSAPLLPVSANGPEDLLASLAVVSRGLILCLGSMERSS